MEHFDEENEFKDLKNSNSLELLRLKKWISDYKIDIEKYHFYQDTKTIHANVNGDVNLSNKGLSEIPVKFGRVSENFECQNNELSSLDFAPEFIGGVFNCSNNKINDFDNIPIKHVEGNFYAYGADPDKLSNLKSIVKGKIYPSH